MVLTVLVLLLGRKDESVADFDRAGFDAPGEDAAFVEAIHILDRKAQRLIASAARRL